VKKKTPAAQLATFMDRYSPEVAAVAKAALVKLRKRLPGAVEMVYANYNALVIGFGPSDRASEAILSIALYPRWVNLFFLHGAKLPDPHKLLQGKGSQVRSILIEDGTILDRREIDDLIEGALQQNATPFDATKRRIIKSISPVQRPRRLGN